MQRIRFILNEREAAGDRNVVGTGRGFSSKWSSCRLLKEQSSVVAAVAKSYYPGDGVCLCVLKVVS
jgi:hypothetical protein